MVASGSSKLNARSKTDSSNSDLSVASCEMDDGQNFGVFEKTKYPCGP